MKMKHLVNKSCSHFFKIYTHLFLKHIEDLDAFSNTFNYKFKNIDKDIIIDDKLQITNLINLKKIKK